MKVVTSKGLGRVCLFHSLISSRTVVVISEVLRCATRLVHEMQCGLKVARSNYFCPTFNELHLHQQTFSASAFGVMTFSYPPEI